MSKVIVARLIKVLVITVILFALLAVIPNGFEEKSSDPDDPFQGLGVVQASTHFKYFGFPNTVFYQATGGHDDPSYHFITQKATYHGIGEPDRRDLRNVFINLAISFIVSVVIVYSYGYIRRRKV